MRAGDQEPYLVARGGMERICLRCSCVPASLGHWLGRSFILTFIQPSGPYPSMVAEAGLGELCFLWPQVKIKMVEETPWKLSQVLEFEKRFGMYFPVVLETQNTPLKL